ncbi:MAG TPA: hypothetical protein VGR07_09345 [Thermoanaerobaculia bacterium]|nr:hypothetical protein [Thermoanaerobaculia bacterium]
MAKRNWTLATTAGLLIVLGAHPAGAGPLSRWVADFRFGPEQIAFKTASAGGNLVYTRVFPLPVSEHTLFVTISTTGDAHEGVAHWFSASVNGVVCNKGDEGAGFAPPGWIPLQKHFDYEKVTYRSNGVGGLSGGDGGGGNGDMHDNGIYYTWCCMEGVKPGGPNKVEIRMATSFANDPVFIERSHFYVDSVRERLCRPAPDLPRIPGEEVPAAMKEKALQRQPPAPQPQKPPR